MANIRYEMMDLHKHYYECVDLCEAWWKESLFYEKTKLEYNVDINQFINLDNAGYLMGFAGFDEDGDMCACYVCTVFPFLFNPAMLQANEMVWHIREDVRSLRNLKDFVNKIDEVMQKRGVHMSNLSLPYDKLKTGKALTRFGYYNQDTQFIKIHKEI